MLKRIGGGTHLKKKSKIENYTVIQLDTILNEKVEQHPYINIMSKFTTPNYYIYFLAININDTETLLIGLSPDRRKLIKKGKMKISKCVLHPERKAKVYICRYADGDKYYCDKIHKSINLIYYYLKHKLFLKGRLKDEYK